MRGSAACPANPPEPRQRGRPEPPIPRLPTAPPAGLPAAGRGQGRTGNARSARSLPGATGGTGPAALQGLTQAARNGAGTHKGDDLFQSKILSQIGFFSFSFSQCPLSAKYYSKRVGRAWGELHRGESLHRLLERVISSNSEGRGPNEKTAPPHLGCGTSDSKCNQFTTVQDKGVLRPQIDNPPMMLLPADPHWLLKLPPEPGCSSHHTLTVCPGSQPHMLELASPAGLTLASTDSSSASTLG